MRWRGRYRCSRGIIAALAVAAGAFAAVSIIVATHGDQSALRDAEPSPTRPAENPASERPEILTIPVDDRSNVPFPSGIIGATTLYTESDGHRDRMVWAGGAGCHYGRAGSCDINGNNDFKRLGMIIDESIDLNGLDDHLGEPLLLADTGLITFTSFSGDRVYFKTETAGSGFYSLRTQRATLNARG